VLIRQCATTDIEALERHLPTRPRQVHSQHFAHQQAGRWTYLIAWEGWAGWAEHDALAAYPDCPQLTNLHVQAARRGRGVGTALIASAEERARAGGFSRIGVGVADDNPKAAMLYTRLGYPDDAGVSGEIVEHNILLVKDLDDGQPFPAR
jgi:GNAT superfamily N-acetyltransferase